MVIKRGAELALCT